MPADVTTSSSQTAEADACLDLALDCMAAGDPQQAIPHLHRAISLNPGHSAATHALVRALEDTGRVEEALILTRQCIAADSDDALAYTRLSILLQRMGDIPAAEAAAARAKILGWKLQLEAGSSWCHESEVG